MKTLQQSVVQFARNACALTHPRFEGHIELVGELTACIVKRLCQDRQLVTSENLRSVLKITTSQGLGACCKFGERNCNRPVAYNPAQRPRATSARQLLVQV